MVIGWYDELFFTPKFLSAGRSFFFTFGGSGGGEGSSFSTLVMHWTLDQQAE